MTMEDICEYQLPEVADDARLFLWTVAAMPEEGYSTMRALESAQAFRVVSVALSPRTVA